MDILEEIKDILTDIFNVKREDITPDTYLAKDLGSESIELLELAIALNSRFDIKVDEDTVFLKRVGFYIEEARRQGKDPVTYMEGRLSFLSRHRIKNIIKETKGLAPPLKVKDLVAYVTWQKNMSGV